MDKFTDMYIEAYHHRSFLPILNVLPIFVSRSWLKLMLTRHVHELHRTIKHPSKSFTLQFKRRDQRKREVSDCINLAGIIISIITRNIEDDICSCKANLGMKYGLVG